MENTPIIGSKPPHFWDNLRNFLYVIGMLALFFFSLDLMVSSLQHLGNNAAETVIMATALLVIIACYGVFALFAFITLPVEFDASKRALAWIESRGIVTRQEHDMAKDALKWAAMTYVVAAIGAVTTLLYYVMIFLGRRD